jgi:hypothetical protein
MPDDERFSCPGTFEISPRRKEVIDLLNRKIP